MADPPRLTVWILPRPVHVAVPERRVLEPVNSRVIREVRLHGELRRCVGRLGVFLERLTIRWRRGVAVYRPPRGREHHARARTVTTHRFQQIQRPDDGRLRIEDRFSDTLW